MDLSVQIGSLRLKNPIMSASGCFGYGLEYAGVATYLGHADDANLNLFI